MLDIKKIRENPDILRNAIKNRNKDIDIDIYIPMFIAVIFTV